MQIDTLKNDLNRQSLIASLASRKCELTFSEVFAVAKHFTHSDYRKLQALIYQGRTDYARNLIKQYIKKYESTN